MPNSNMTPGEYLSNQMDNNRSNEKLHCQESLSSFCPGEGSANYGKSTQLMQGLTDDQQEESIECRRRRYEQCICILSIDCDSSCGLPGELTGRFSHT